MTWNPVTCRVKGTGINIFHTGCELRVLIARAESGSDSTLAACREVLLWRRTDRVSRETVAPPVLGKEGACG